MSVKKLTDYPYRITYVSEIDDKVVTSEKTIYKLGGPLGYVFKYGLRLYFWLKYRKEDRPPLPEAIKLL